MASIMNNKIIQKMCTTVFTQPNRGLKLRRKFIGMGHYHLMQANSLHPSLKQRIDALNPKLLDPELHKPVNIGYSLKNSLQADKLNEKSIVKRKKDLVLERMAWKNTLFIDLHDVAKEWNDNIIARTAHVRPLAEHFHIFKDLFNEYAYFYPVTKTEVNFDYLDTDLCSPIHYGNFLKPHEAATEPKVKIDSKVDELWTLVLLNPDGNLYERDSEMVHWFVGNIPGGDVTKGEVIFDYLQPIPPSGTGFHRYIFLLYKQKQEIDYSEYKNELPCLNLRKRTFKNGEFYRKFEDIITPSGLLWFQADYDHTISDFFHHALKMKEPAYEYQFEKPYISEERRNPSQGKAFNRYIDLHKDPKDFQMDILKERLESVDPIEGDVKQFPYPLAQLKLPNIVKPIWLHVVKKCRLTGKGKYRDYYRFDARPAKKRSNVERILAKRWEL